MILYNVLTEVGRPIFLYKHEQDTKHEQELYLAHV